MMEFLELAKNRYSERSFASKLLEEEKLTENERKELLELIERG